ncbi:MAG: purine nucleoside phosphorylase inosine and guanosine-specific [Fibrobacteres bacterium]|nr:purine nucleoside phosphorylase inosine and guanosine-specific [Fibrobacterota bacterium]
MPALPETIEAARAHIAGRCRLKPEIGIILGTGLGPVAAHLEPDADIPYGEIPHFASPTVDGHEGRWISGRVSGRPAAVMQGRFHFYEGHSMQDIAFPIRVMKALGVQSLFITNIAGGVNAGYRPGDLMVITDHINLLGTNPLIGANTEAVGPRFPDMSRPYDRALTARLMELGAAKGIALKKGVYACMSGPCLETAAEYRMLRIIGADAVGMSTVPEVIAAVHAGLRTVALSLITDACDPDDLQAIDIPAIMRVAGEAEPKIAQLVRGLAPEM